MKKKRSGSRRQFEQRSELRRKIGKVLSSQYLMGVMSSVIFVNLILVIMETDFLASNREIPVWLQVFNILLLLLYTVELVARLYVERREFFSDFLNVMDFFVVASDIVILLLSQIVGDLPSVSALRIMRLVRLSRAYKVMLLFPELSMMLRGLVGAFKAILWGSVMISFILIIWGILAVQFIHPLNVKLTEQGIWDEAGCERCPRAFETVFQAMLTFTQQIVAGDSWGQLSVPIIEHYPLTGVFFPTVLVSVNLATLNLILAVIVDQANQGQRESDSELAMTKERERASARDKFVGLCRQIDKDGKGHLTYEELDSGWENNAEFQELMNIMDIEKEDLKVVFEMLDVDGSGTVEYSEFAHELQKLRSHDIRTLLVFIKFYVVDIFSKVREQLKCAKLTNKAVGDLTQSGSKDDLSPELKALMSPHLQRPAERPQLAGLSAASTWGERLERSTSARGGKEAKLPSQLSPELAQLRDDLAQGFARLADKVEQHTQALEAVPLLTTPPGGCGSPGHAVRWSPRAEASDAMPGNKEPPISMHADSRGRKFPKGQAQGTMICCRAQREQVQRLT